MSNARSTTNNYLTQKRKAAGFTVKALSEAIGCAYSTTSSYFTGFVNPSDDVVHVICKYLDMDYHKCRKEFDKTFNAWGVAHADKYEKVGNTTYQTRKDLVDDSSDLDLSVFNTEVDDTEDQPDMYDITKYLELLYGKISYDIFTPLCAMGTTAEDILRYLYGKVDYTLYKELVNLG